MYDHYGAQVRRQLKAAHEKAEFWRKVAVATTDQLGRAASAHQSTIVEARRQAARAEQAEADLAIAEQHIARGNEAATRAWSELRITLRRLTETRAELADLREGEEPYEDERGVPTPGQWIWKWNRVTAAERLEAAEIVIEARNHQRECFMQKWPERARQAEARIASQEAELAQWRAAAQVPLLPTLEGERDRARQQLAAAEARIAAVRALHRPSMNGRDCEGCYDYSGDPLPWPCPTVAALDGPAEQPAAPCRPIPASIAAPQPVQTPPLAAMAELAQRARAKQRVEQRHLEEAIYWRATLAGLNVHWATSGVQQVAGHPTTLARLTASPFYPPPAVEPSGVDPLRVGLPLVPDDTLPPGEVHLRPHPRVEPEEPPAVAVQRCRCGHEQVEHAETVCRTCVFTGRRALSQHGYIAADGPS